jgi:hypothetical protein
MRGVVVDADGVVLGPYIAPQTNSSYPAFMAALVRLGDLPVAIQLAPGKNHLQGTPFYDTTQLVPGTTADRVLFKSGNCSGKAFVFYFAYGVAGPAPAAVIADGHGAATVYLPTHGAPRTETAASYLYVRGAGRSPECAQGANTAPMFEVDQVIDLSTVYKTPYHLE